MEELEPLVGDWDVRLTFPPETGLDEIRGTTSFAWTLGGVFLLQTSAAEDPKLPNTTSLIGADGDAYRQYYFDSRGVVRQYAMTFDGRVWTLERDDDDFAQRFRVELSADGTELAGAWNRTDNGAWMHDFDITYTRSV